ncbi:hypothetical protein DL767_001536 [Monosporascus sp. MG133]|nr:hypothetical protein DL767_001536 [Monosporascus sp. MG133]
MSGAEVIGLISGIISIAEAIIEIHGAVQDASGLPSAFRDVARRMPLLKDSLIAAQRGMEDGANNKSYTALKEVLESCKDKADSLERIFKAITVKPKASRAGRYSSAVRSLGKGRKVEELMDSILADMQLLTGNYAIKSPTRAQVQELIVEMRKGPAVHPADGQHGWIANYGTGLQSIHTGTGDQNLNTGSGTQLSGNFAGPFTFYSRGVC